MNPDEKRGYAVLVNGEWRQYPTAKYIVSFPVSFGFDSGGSTPTHLCVNDGNKHLAMFRLEDVEEVRLMTAGEREQWEALCLGAGVGLLL